MRSRCLSLLRTCEQRERESGGVCAGSGLRGEESLLFRLHSLAPLLLCPAIYLPSQRTTRFLIFFLHSFRFLCFLPVATGRRRHRHRFLRFRPARRSFIILRSLLLLLSLSLLLCCSLARLYVSSEHCSSLSELTFFALFALRVCLFALL